MAFVASKFPTRQSLIPVGVGIALSVEVNGEGKVSAPTAFRIFRAGVNTTSDKGDFVFDDASAASVMAAYTKKSGGGRAPLTMDYDHAVLYAGKNGQKAPNSAYAWTPQIRHTAEGPELWATDVKWTDEARGEIERREYVYFSPLFLAPDGHIDEVVNLALTNVPSLDGLDQLIAAALGGRHTQGDVMHKCSVCQREVEAGGLVHEACADLGRMSRVLVAAGLRRDLQEPDALSALQMMGQLPGQLQALTGTTSLAEALGRVAVWKDDAGKYTALKAETEKNEKVALSKRWNDLLDGAAKTGQLAPNGAKRKAIVDSMLMPSKGEVTAAACDALALILPGLPKEVVTTTEQRHEPTVTPGGGPAPTPIPASQGGMAFLMGINGKKLEEFEKFRAAAGTAGAMPQA